MRSFQLPMRMRFSRLLRTPRQRAANPPDSEGTYLLNTLASKSVTRRPLATLAVTFDHESFRGKLMEPGKTGMAGSTFSTHMTQSLTSVREICLKSDDGKKAVKSKINKIVLQHAGGSRAHKLEKGQLTTVLDPSVAPREWQTKFSEFLKRSL